MVQHPRVFWYVLRLGTASVKPMGAWGQVPMAEFCRDFAVCMENDLILWWVAQKPERDKAFHVRCECGIEAGMQAQKMKVGVGILAPLFMPHVF